MDNIARQSLADGLCLKLAQEGGTVIYEAFLSTPLEPDMMNRAIGICKKCNVTDICFMIHYDNDSVIAGATTPYMRKLMKWKRIENVRESNWRSIGEFADYLRRKKEQGISSV